MRQEAGGDNPTASSMQMRNFAMGIKRDLKGVKCPKCKSEDLETVE